jgi:hypothetical protein
VPNSTTGLGTVSPLHGADANQEYTFLILGRSNSVSPILISVINPANNLPATPVVFGSPQTNLTALPSVSTDAPVYYAVTYNNNSADGGPFGRMTLSLRSMDVYGVWVVEGKVPVVTPRFLDSYRQIGFPLPMAGDLTPDLVTPGQTYIESINGVTVEKVALDAVVWKPMQNQFSRVYELRNKGSIIAERLPVITPGALSYNNRVGGQVAASGVGFSRLFPAVTFPFGKTFTVGFRGISTQPIRIWFYNGGSNLFTYLKSDGTWETTATQQTIAIGSGFARQLNLAFTFAMPDSSFAGALGNSPYLNIVPVGSLTAPWTPAFICEGSSACVSAASAMDTGPDKDVGAAEPTSGYYPRGFIRYNSAPSPSGTLGWVCTTAGIAGSTAVFKTFGAISA